jgi:hypothetical protein
MPYIKQQDRETLLYRDPDTPGELNYMISCLAEYYCRVKGDSYQTFNDILGAFDGASREFYRRVVAPYEDKKIKENGDVFRDRNAVVQPQTETGAKTTEPHSEGPAQPEVSPEDTTEQEVKEQA